MGRGWVIIKLGGGKNYSANSSNGTVQLCKKDEPTGTDRTVMKHSDNNIYSGAYT